MKTLQEQYNLIKEGKGDKLFFLKSAKNQFPNLINQFTTYDNAVNIFKTKGILSEGIGGLVTTGKEQDWHQIFKSNLKEEYGTQEAKAEEKKPTKDVIDTEIKGYDYKDLDNIDNIYGEQFLRGFYTEMRDPKNEEKSVEDLRKIVAKNLKKDRLFYVKDGQFGVKGLGYTEDAPGLGKSKEAKGKYKSSGYGDLKESKSLNFSKYSNDALKDMIVNLSRFEDTKDMIQTIKDELKKRETNKPLKENSDFEGTGLVIVGRTQLDNNAIGDMLDETDFYGVWNTREGYWFFPEDEETLDILEKELEHEFVQRGINARFEGQYRELNELDNQIDLSKISNVEFEGIDYNDAPDFVDAYISNASIEISKEEYDDCDESLNPYERGGKYYRDLTEEELEIINEDHYFVDEKLRKYLH
jgi:hypothetical protein